MPIHGSFFPTYVCCTFKARTRFPRTWWICSNIAFGMRFPEVLGLTVIPYSSWIRVFLNSLPINYFPWSYVISIGLGYLYSHVDSSKFSIVIALLSSYCKISNHPVMGSIIVTDFRYKFSFLPLHRMTQVPIRSTHILFHGIRGPAQDVPFFYAPTHLSELQSFKSIISTNISGIFVF